MRLIGAILLLFVSLTSANANTSRDCLDGKTTSLLNSLEARFGKVALVKTCVRGARMPSGHVSWHARNAAFDFKVPARIDKRDVMVWLTANSPGVTISYRGKLAGIVHTDTGTFKKVIYNAANEEAGHRAVAIWQAREQTASLPAAIEKPKAKPPAPAYDLPFASVAEFDGEQQVRPQNIFDRFLHSLSIVVQPQVRLKCEDGSPMPAALQTLALDAADFFGKKVMVNSAYRPRWYNAKIRGAARNSEHIKCTRTRGAMDFRVVGVSSTTLFAWVKARTHIYSLGGLGFYGPLGHVHVDTRFADLPKKAKVQLVTWQGGKRRHVRKNVTRLAQT